MTENVGPSVNDRKAEKIVESSLHLDPETSQYACRIAMLCGRRTFQKWVLPVLTGPGKICRKLDVTWGFFSDTRAMRKKMTCCDENEAFNHCTYMLIPMAYGFTVPDVCRYNLVILWGLGDLKGIVSVAWGNG